MIDFCDQKVGRMSKKLTDFFTAPPAKKKKQTETEEDEEPPLDTPEIQAQDADQPSTSGAALPQSASPTAQGEMLVDITEEDDPAEGNVERTGAAGLSPAAVPKWDIGNFVGVQATRDQKYRLLTAPWTPDKGYQFPTQVRMQSTKRGEKKARTLTFQEAWFARFPFIAFSAKDGGVYCRSCVLFAGQVAGGNPLSTLCTVPLANWKDALEILNNHSVNKYHEMAHTRAEAFKSAHVRGDVMEVMEPGSEKAKSRHRFVLSAVIDTVKLCGRQNIALRGTGNKDSGPLTNPSQFETAENQGNFRSIMRLACHHSPKLEVAIDAMPRNATYLSPMVQNEIIDTCGEIVQKTVVEKVKKASIFSILADETSDVSQVEQLSISVRYVDESEGNPKVRVREDFLGFLPVHDLTGQALADVLLGFLRNVDLDPANLRGQGYDGASNMSGQFRGVQAIICQQFPLALYTHCNAHVLSLVCAKSCDLPAFRKMFKHITEVTSFIRNSPKRTDVLQNAIAALCPENSAKRLKALCPTRWVEKHQSLVTFDEMLAPILHTLQELQKGQEAAKAEQFRLAMNTFPFIVTLKAAVLVFAKCVMCEPVGRSSVG